MLVEVALPLPVLKNFTYAVPDELSAQVAEGMRVLVPFGRNERIGWVDRVHPDAKDEKAREVVALLDSRPSLPAPIHELCRWAADYYVVSLGQMIRTTLPAGLSDASTDLIEVVAQPDSTEELPELEVVVLDWLAMADGPQPVPRLRRERGNRSWWPILRRMEEKGFIRILTEPPKLQAPVRTRKVVHLTRQLPSLLERQDIFGRAKRQRECYEFIESIGGSAELAVLGGQHGFSPTVTAGLVEKGLARITDEEVQRDPYAALPAAESARLTPTPEQKSVIDTLVAAARTPTPGTHLLRGVTGSGKTLVYIELLREVVDVQGRSAIVLVPEIALTPQTVGRFRAVFGNRVAVLHSALSAGERFDEWRALRSGEKRIAVGARSAIFAPLLDLGAIIVDEEHEASYKQGENPRYHAREVAIVRSAAEGAVCLLGSATPSLESWHNAMSGRYHLHNLPNRATGQRLPAVRIVDLRAERKRMDVELAGQPGPIVLSTELHEAITERLRKSEQTILLLNRRGYSNFVQCQDCGEVWDCPSCAVSLTYHRRRGQLTCHYCLYEEAAPERCPRCLGSDVTFRGVGTEQVERTVGEAFPEARLARMDVDTTSAKWSHHRILEAFGSGGIDILLGTQMIAKGLDFPGVTLVGVINADVGINLPDFRASERTFQLLTQVAGRAGRGPKGGEVIVQTSLPTNYAIQRAIEHDYPGFAELELEARKSPIYPPFCRLVNIVFSARDEGAPQETADRAAEWLRGLIAARSLAQCEVVGPAPCPIERIRDRWRWHFFLRAEDPKTLGRITRFFAERFKVAAGSHELRMVIDRDPVALL